MTTHGPRAAPLTRRRWYLIAVAALSLWGALSWPSPRPASAASNGQWAVFPTTLPGQPPRASVTTTLTPGKVYVDSVTVANYTVAPLKFNLYSADAINTQGDGLSLRRRTDVQTAMGKWIKLPYALLTVPARGTSVVPFSILPPANATPGDYLGGIVAEATQGTTSSRGSIPITVIQAVGVRIYGRVAGPLNPRLEMHHLSLSVHTSVVTELSGTVGARVDFVVTNLGNSILSPVATVELSTPFGTAARRSWVINDLLPGSSLQYSLTFASVRSYGHLHAEVTVRGSGAHSTGTVSAWTVPWALLVIVVLVIIATIVIIRRRRRHPGVPQMSDSDVNVSS